MKSFLLNSENKPIVKWGSLPNNTFFEGVVPNGYSLAISPSENYVILDVDVKGNKNGFKHIPQEILNELLLTFFYTTKSGGAHYWIKYTGDKTLINKSTELGLDLRIGAKGSNSGGYVKYHNTTDIRQCIHLIENSSQKMNEFLENLFS